MGVFLLLGFTLGVGLLAILRFEFLVHYFGSRLFALPS
jgi:hypothetical protein